MASTCAAAALSLRDMQVPWELTAACGRDSGCENHNMLRHACMRAWHMPASLAAMT